MFRECIPFRVLCVLCLLSVGSRAFAVDLGRSFEFDIPAGTRLDDALILWSDQIGVPVSISGYSAPPDRKTSGVRGTLLACEALRMLLQDTGLSYEETPESVLVLPARTGDGVPLPPCRPPKSKSSLEARERSAEVRTGDPATVLVVGSRIREEKGDRNRTDDLNVIHIDKSDFERSGYQSLSDLFRDFPQSFAGSPNIGVLAAGGPQNAQSQSPASLLNIRGLGNGATLSLIDGHRMAPVQSFGVPDLSLIPLSVIDRISILTDGASAIYGADAIAGVVNITLRKDYEGFELAGNFGGAADGGGTSRRYDAVYGHGWDDGQLLLAYEHVRQNQINAADRSYLLPDIAGTSLLPATLRNSLLLNTTQTLFGVEVGFEGLLTRRSSLETENLSFELPGASVSTQTEVKQYVYVLSGTRQLSDTWTITASWDLAADLTSSPETLTRNDSSGMGGDAFRNHFRSVETSADGTVLTLPAGPAKLALGGGRNEEALSLQALPAGTFPISQRRTVEYAYGEAHVPLWGHFAEGDSQTGMILKVAGRVDHYNDMRATANPKVGMVYIPTSDLTLQATWSTSFRPPSLLELYDPPQADFERVPAPGPGGGYSYVVLRVGGNRLLLPERSATTSFAMSLRPSQVPGTFFRVNGYVINYRNKIEYPSSNTGNPLQDPDMAHSTSYGPSAAQLNSVIDSSQFANLTGLAYDSSVVAALADDRYQNVDEQIASGVDLQFGYRRRDEDRRSPWTVAVDLAYLNLRQRFAASTPFIPQSGTVFNPPKYKASGAIGWDWLGLSLSTSVNYVGRSRDVDSTPQQSVGSWTTFSSRIAYTVGGEGPWRRFRVAVSAQNLFDKRPPFIKAAQMGVIPLPLDTTNTSAVGLYLTVQVSKAW